MRNSILGWMCGLALACAGFPASAHEFWIAPEDYMTDPGESVVAGLMVGQMMRGADYPYLSGKFRAFTITNRQETRNAIGLEGDIPALSFAADQPGLHIIAFHAIPNFLTFDSIAEFTEYLDYEGLGAIALAHRKRGLPESGFSESYIRCAKALVQVGPITEADRDRPIGLPFELVAEANPYESGLQTLPVTLRWQGKPVAERQIAVFRDDGETVARTLVVTDADGRAQIPIADGGQFLLNAVNMEPIETGDAVWESHWASLTFGLRRR